MPTQAQSGAEVWLHPSRYFNGKSEWAVTATLRPLYLRKGSGTDRTGGCAGDRAGLHAHGKFRPHWDLIPGPTTLSQPPVYNSIQ
jgi:hypothetical protein